MYIKANHDMKYESYELLKQYSVCRGRQLCQGYRSCLPFTINENLKVLQYYYPPLMLPGWLVHLFMFALISLLIGLILVLLIQSEKLHGLSFNINYYETNLGKTI